MRAWGLGAVVVAVAALWLVAGCGAVAPTHGAAVVDAGANCCGDACVDLNLDPLHCGSCDTVCPSGNICFGGHCGCPPFGSKCGGSQSCCGSNGCVSLDSDIRNCGGCGVRCPEGVACVHGSCAGASAAASPPPGFCSCADGCAGDPDRTCLGMNCCHAAYVAGECMPDRSCGLWKYP